MHILGISELERGEIPVSSNGNPDYASRVAFAGNLQKKSEILTHSMFKVITALDVPWEKLVTKKHPWHMIRLLTAADEIGSWPMKGQCRHAYSSQHRWSSLEAIMLGDWSEGTQVLGLLCFTI